MTKEGVQYGVVQSVQRALRVLESIASQRETRLTDVAKDVGLHKSTVFRLLQTLVDAGYVEHGPQNGLFRLGLKAMELGVKAMDSWPLYATAKEEMDKLAEQLGEAINLAVVDELTMVYVATIGARNALRMQLSVGRRSPIHCTAVGKAVLAHRPDLQALIRPEMLEAYTPNTLSDVTLLQENLGLIKFKGYAVDDEEQEIGARCVAAPIFERSGRAIAAIGVSAPAARLTRGQIDAIGVSVREAAAGVSARLGFAGT